jgi:tRNA(Ile)-lysidine synthase
MPRELAQRDATLPRICVAFSGGLDSTVLLHQLAHACAREAILLSAVHVHHGLSKNADAWARHCRRICKGLAIPLTVRRVVVSRASGTSLEEEARRSRYAAFALVKADVIALAHHADDQAETLLLQLLRGAGPKGLAGMPLLKALSTNGLDQFFLWRPLLSCSRIELDQYARRHHLDWIEDESNQDLRFKRNFVRQRLMPIVAEAFPASVAALARAARHQAETVGLIAALADADLVQARASSATLIAAADGGTNVATSAQSGIACGSLGLDVAALKRLDVARLKNVLRRWLELAALRQPSEARLAALVKAVGDSSNDTRLAWPHDGRIVRRKKGLLRLD